MATYVTANENAKQEFKIPVSWQVSDFIKVQANSLEEALNYAQENIEEISLGDDPQYIDGSYKVEDEECCVYNDANKKPICMSFSCNDLSQYTDSMMFDSGTEIAKGQFMKKGKYCDITLKVLGEVSVTFKGETYHNPSEFPDELMERIITHPNNWDVTAPSGEGNDNTESDIYVGMNNWFEYCVDGCSEISMLFEDDLSKAEESSLVEDMLELADRYFEYIDASNYNISFYHGDKLYRYKTIDKFNKEEVLNLFSTAENMEKKLNSVFVTGKYLPITEISELCHYLGIGGWISTEYNEFNLAIEKPEIGAKAEIIDFEENTLRKAIVTNIIRKSADPETYDKYCKEDKLVELYENDCSGEFVTNDDIFYVYVKERRFKEELLKDTSGCYGAGSDACLNHCHNCDDVERRKEEIKKALDLLSSVSAYDLSVYDHDGKLNNIASKFDEICIAEEIGNRYDKPCAPECFEVAHEIHEAKVNDDHFNRLVDEAEYELIVNTAKKKGWC